MREFCKTKCDIYTNITYNVCNTCSNSNSSLSESNNKTLYLFIYFKLQQSWYKIH